MSVKNGRDYLYLIWHSLASKKQYIIGTLSKNGKFEFEYSNQIDEALKDGFQLLISFPKKKKYESEELFPVFASRLPDKKRIDIKDILKKYNLTEYDEYKLLKASGAKLPIDNLQFIDPILENDEKDITRKFSIAGSRHYMNCNEGKNCLSNINIKVGDNLNLELEPDNKYDSNAIKILKDDILIGYIPRYYSEGVTKKIQKGAKVKCIVSNVNKDNKCTDCVIVELKISE